MNVELAPRTSYTSSWKDELVQLLALPLFSLEATYREGATLGLRLSPQDFAEGQTVDLVVCLYLRYLSPPAAAEAETDPLAFPVFLQGLHDPDLHVRLTACEALGQLGNPAARPALEKALQDDDPLLRLAAEQALAVLAAPRVRAEDLGGLRLLIWRQVRHLWQPMGAATTNRKGEARFRRLPLDGVYRLQLLDSQLVAQGNLGQERSLSVAAERREDNDCTPEAMAASDRETSAPPLPQSRRLSLADGSLTCTLYHNDDGAPVLEFRSEAPSLQGGCIYFTVTRKDTGALVFEGVAPLQPDVRGILTSRILLTDHLSPTQAYEIHFAPAPVPRQEKE